jgi:hypothetical protein
MTSFGMNAVQSHDALQDANDLKNLVPELQEFIQKMQKKTDTAECQPKSSLKSSNTPEM